MSLFVALKKRGLILTVLIGALVFCAAGPVWAQGGGEPSSPEAIEKHLEQLRVTYKEGHPEIQRYKRALEKAKENEAMRKTDQMKLEMQRQRQTAPTPAPLPGE